MVGGLSGCSARDLGHHRAKRQDNGSLARSWHTSSFIHGHSCNRQGLRVSGITIFRVAGGRIAEVWVYADVPSLVSSLREAHEAQEKAKAPAPQFSDDLLPGPAARFMRKSFGFGRLLLLNSLLRLIRKDFEPVDKPLELIIPPEIMDEVSVSEIRTPGPLGNVRSLVYRPLGERTHTLPVWFTVMAAAVHGRS